MPGVTVIGGAGFIGSNIVDELIRYGHTVTVLDDFSEGRHENLISAVKSGLLEVIRGDVRDFDTVRRVVDGRSCVFHLAAMSRIQPSIVEPLDAFTKNYVGTVNVAEACRLGGVPRVVYSASSSAYGSTNDGVLLAGGGLTEDLPTDCLNPYSLSKKGGEEVMELYRRLYGLSTVSLRYFNVYGPRHQETGSYATVIAIFRRQRKFGQALTVVGDGEQRRDFTFVGDVVRANMLAMMNRDATGVINIGTGKNHSINQVASFVGGTVEFIPVRPGEARTTLADVRKAAEVLGWMPTVDLQTGLLALDAYENRHGPLVIGGY